MLTEYSSEKPLASGESNRATSFQPQKQEPDRLSATSVVVEPTHFVSSLDFKSFWEYRELIYFLALRDVKIRYKQTLLGVLWVILQPIITTVIFTAIFLRLGQSQNSAVPYSLFAFSGFTLWTFINSAIANSSNSLINHSALITKVYFPRLVIPLSAVGATLVDLALGLATLFAALLIYDVPLTRRFWLIPLVIIPTLFLSLGLGIITAALNVKYRDVKYILPFALQLLLFASPVFYSLSMLAEGSTWAWQFNPLTGILENFRALLFGLPFEWSSYLYSIVFSSAIFLLATFVFHQMEDDFADVI